MVNPMKKASITPAAFLGLIIATASIMALEWATLSNQYKILMVVALVLEIVAQLTGVKKTDIQAVLMNVKDYLDMFKSAHPNDPAAVLTNFEASIVYLVKSWDRLREWYEDIFFNKDGKRDGKLTPTPAKAVEAPKV